jgi:hypothetical protein
MRRLLWVMAFCVVAAIVRRPDATSETRDAAEGVGKEAAGISSRARAACDPSYPTHCIPVGVADLDCADVGAKNFPVRGPDPHRFDVDHDGRGCEPWPR